MLMMIMLLLLCYYRMKPLIHGGVNHITVSILYNNIHLSIYISIYCTLM